jgi:hypothetical protein
MKLTWAVTIVTLSFLMMGILKNDEINKLQPYYSSQKTFKLANFQSQKVGLKPSEVELLELWESMLTGRSAPVAKWIKSQYQTLGLNHLFTPSGFHLSAVMVPFMKLLPTKRWHLLILMALGIGLFLMPGQGALKRMVAIKINQNLFGQKEGFILALVFDVLLGSFTNSPLSFCYSFLFLGIIYSKKNFLFLWFFFAQCLIAYFSGVQISPLILLLSSCLNVAFAVAMPALFLLAIPLWDWQLHIGLMLLSGLQAMVKISATLTSLVPAWEINTWSLICFALFYFRMRKRLAMAILVLSSGVNTPKKIQPTLGNFDFAPNGFITKIVNTEKDQRIYWTDGTCRRELMLGVWWEKCSPRRKSTRKKFKKLSSL